MANSWIVGGVFPHGARRAIAYGDGWVPHRRRPQYEEVADFVPEFRRMAEAAGRDARAVPVTVFDSDEDAERLLRYRDLAIARVVVSLPSAREDVILPALDRWAQLIERLA